MSENNNGGPAFPILASEYGGHGTHEGMTLRDYFAAKAMQGQVSNGRWGHEIIARDAYAIADAMLAAREKGRTE